jgi:hypothetical protein
MYVTLIPEVSYSVRYGDELLRGLRLVSVSDDGQAKFVDAVGGALVLFVPGPPPARAPLPAAARLVSGAPELLARLGLP